METEENVGQEEMVRRGYWWDPIRFARNKRKNTVFIFHDFKSTKQSTAIDHGFRLD